MGTEICINENMCIFDQSLTHYEAENVICLQ